MARRIVVIGSSTGGPVALGELLSLLPGRFPAPIFISQHMPEHISKMMVARLNGKTALRVVMAEDNELARPGHVYICPGGKHLSISKHKALAVAALSSEPKTAMFHPCVDILFESAAESFGAEAVGVILTGMGKDGLIGAGKMKATRAMMLAQDEKSSVVWGMPRVVHEAGLADKTLPLRNISKELRAIFGV